MKITICTVNKTIPFVINWYDEKEKNKISLGNMAYSVLFLISTFSVCSGNDEFSICIKIIYAENIKVILREFVKIDLKTEHDLPV